MIIGMTFIVAGILTMPTPVPLGLVLVVVGLYFVARASRSMRGMVVRMRRHSPGFSRCLNRIRHRMPNSMRAFIDNSDPDR